MPVVNPGIRRLLASAIQRLFNGASFSAPLTHSLVPERGTGSPTFTRATTATVRDNEGVLRTAIAGEARFEGARYVRNLLTFTEDFSNAVWSITGITRTATTITEQATGTDHSVRYIVASGKNIWQIKVKPNGRTRCALASTGSVNKSAIFNLTTGLVEGALTDAFTTLGDNPTIALQSDGYYLITMGNLSGTSTLVDLYLLDATSTTRAYAGDNTKGMFLKQAQLEDITGRADQTTPSEYVSVGVPSDWHGTELVTNGTFDSGTTGWTAGLSAVLSVVSNEMQIENGGASFGYAYTSITTVVGSKYVVSALSRVGTTVAIQLAAGTTPADTSLGSTSTASATNTLLTFTFTATGTTTYITFQNQTNTAGHTSYADKISVKPAIYHGAGVDGVKYFDTDLSGNPIPASTLLGYVAEGARTNLCLQSQDFATTWVLARATCATNNTVAPDGTTTADTLTAASGTTTSHFALQYGIVPSATTQSYSIYAKAGTSNFICLNLQTTANNYVSKVFDLGNGVLGETSLGSSSGTLVSSSITSVGNGWYRLNIVAQVTGASGLFVIFFANAATGNSFTTTGDVEITTAGTETLMVWGAQVELGSFASSYIATTTAAVTRDADVLTYSSAGNIDGTKGWCYAEVNGSNVSYLSTDGAYYVTSDTSSDSPILYNVPVPPGKLSTFDGTSIINGDAITANIKGCVSWGGTSRSISVNGGTPVSGAFDGAIITGSSIGIGHKVGGITSAYGHIRNVYIGQRQLSASELQAITS